MLTTVKDWWLDHAKRKREGRHLSLMTAFALDRFIEGCANVAVDEGEPNQEGYYETQTTPPKFDPTSTQGDWRSVPLGITDAVFSLQLAAEEVAARVSVAFEFDTPPDWDDGFKVRQTGYADLGIRAF